MLSFGYAPWDEPSFSQTVHQFVCCLRHDVRRVPLHASSTTASSEGRRVFYHPMVGVCCGFFVNPRQRNPCLSCPPLQSVSYRLWLATPPACLAGWSKGCFRKRQTIPKLLCSPVFGAAVCVHDGVQTFSTFFASA